MRQNNAVRCNGRKILHLKYFSESNSLLYAVDLHIVDALVKLYLFYEYLKKMFWNQGRNYLLKGALHL